MSIIGGSRTNSATLSSSSGSIHQFTDILVLYLSVKDIYYTVSMYGATVKLPHSTKDSYSEITMKM